MMLLFQEKLMINCGILGSQHWNKNFIKKAKQMILQSGFVFCFPIKMNEKGKTAMQSVFLRNTCFTDRAACCAIMLRTHQSQRQAINLHKTKKSLCLNSKRRKERTSERSIDCE